MAESREFHVDVTGAPIDAAALIALVGDPAAGGTAVFIGTTRTPSEGREVAYLEYEAYAPMAVSRMREILAAAAARWPLEGACAVHRVGRVAPGEAAVLVAVSSAHRAGAFEACRHIIDEIKRDVPVWKVEVYADGHRRVTP